MRLHKNFFCPLLVVVVLSALLVGQGDAQSQAIVPRLVNYSGKILNAEGKPLSGIAGVTFAIYKDQSESSPLWLETQNVTADSKGSYTIQLGATKPEGLPLDLFTSGEARWLGVRVNGGEEQPRVMLLSVPYALKAGDAETVGGLPPSAFVLASPVAIGSATSSGSTTETGSPLTVTDVTTTGGTAAYLPIFSGANTIIDSSVFQTVSGTTAKVGINTTTPVTQLDVNGAGTIRGTLSLPATGNATAGAGKNSQGLNLVASSFSSTSGTAQTQVFRWQAEPAANDTTAPSGTLNLLYGLGTAAPGETGLKLSSKGIFTFSTGQTFPGTGSVKSVGLTAPVTDFTVTGSPVTGTGTLKFAWTVAPTNSDTANAIVKRDSGGSFSAGFVTAQGMYTDGGPGSYGIYATSSGVGVQGDSSSGDGVLGVSGATAGVHGLSNTISTPGVLGENSQDDAACCGPDGVDGVALLGSGSGVAGFANSGGNGIYGYSSSGWAGFFYGDVDVDGNLSKAAGSFKIDHPLDPANKYLYHSFVESPDMMNIYNGNVTTDGSGTAQIRLPEWFETLNRDFRYQLTVLGQFAQAIVANEIVNHQFTIQTDKPNVKVSWQVTGIRQDAWANAHRIPVEQLKPESERGLYMHPELFGEPLEKGIGAKNYPVVLKMAKQRAKQLAASGKQ